jgi:hypothetical protein
MELQPRSALNSAWGRATMRQKSLIQRYRMSISRLTLKQTQIPQLPDRSPPIISLVAKSLLQLIETRSLPTCRPVSGIPAAHAGTWFPTESTLPEPASPSRPREACGFHTRRFSVKRGSLPATSALGRTESTVLRLFAQETFDQGSQQWRLLLHRVMATLTE